MTKKYDNQLLLLDYMIANGLEIKNKNILELLQSGSQSISKHIPEHSQYLLSSKVHYDELEDLGIEGANGFFTENGIYIPKNSENTLHFYGQIPDILDIKTVFAIRKSYIYPEVECFDTIIAYYDLAEENDLLQMQALRNFPQSKYIGFVADNETDDAKYLSHCLSTYRKLKDYLSQVNDYYQLEHDHIQNSSKDLYLIKKKK